MAGGRVLVVLDSSRPERAERQHEVPTHQGKSQTDIVVGDAGESATQHSSFEFDASYSDSMTLQYLDAASGASNQDSRYELVLKDAAGTTLATFAAKYTAQGTLGTATSLNTTKSNTWSPSPSGNTPTWPTGTPTSATRQWQVVCTKAGQTFGTHQARWDFVSTVKSGGSVGQVVSTQDDDQLVVTLTYTEGRTVLLTVEVTCEAVVTTVGGVQAGTPSVTDTFTP